MSEPKQFGTYEVIEEIGRRGEIVIYRARDTTRGREVALKVLLPQPSADTTSAKRFLREARIVAALDHPNIVKIYDFGEAAGRTYIVMEFAHSASLATAIAERGCIPWKEAVDLVGPVCEAVDYIHGQGVIHRDLNPSNILLRKEHWPLLAGFSTAKRLEHAGIIVKRRIVGTPAYIAPEGWVGAGASPSADIYALGCTVYEMLTGEVLFAGATPIETWQAHQEGPKFPVQWPEGVPDQVEGILSKALDREPENRFASAGEMAEALRQVIREPVVGEANAKPPLVARLLSLVRGFSGRDKQQPRGRTDGQ